MIAAAYPSGSRGVGTLPPPRELRLLETVATVASRPLSDVLLRAKHMLGDLDTGRSFASRLNNDGSPIQCCVSCSRDEVRYRLLADPHSSVRDSLERRRYSLGQFAECVGTDSSLHRAASLLVDIVAPSARVQHRAWTAGPLWFGQGIADDDIALYANAGWDGRAEGWNSAFKFIRVMTGGQPIASLVRCSGAPTAVASVGLEARQGQVRRIKVYFRLQEACPLGEFGIPDEILGKVLNAVGLLMQDQSISNQGLLLCIGLDASTGRIVDFKMDVCGHCLRLVAPALQERLKAIGQFLEIEMPSMAHLGIGRDIALAFVGIAVDTTQRARVNIYMRGVQ